MLPVAEGRTNTIRPPGVLPLHSAVLQAELVVDRRLALLHWGLHNQGDALYAMAIHMEPLCLALKLNA